MTRASVKVTFLPSDGSSAIEREITANEVLRTCALEAKAPLYSGWDSMMNCGGLGNCATCAVDVKRGGELLSEETDAEKRKRKAGKLQDTWRLACQCVVKCDEAAAGAEIESYDATMSRAFLIAWLASACAIAVHVFGTVVDRDGSSAAPIASARLTLVRTQIADEEALSEHALKRACGTERLRRLERRHTAIGSAYYVLGDVPSGDRGDVDAALATACRRLRRKPEVARRATRAEARDELDAVNLACASAEFGCPRGIDPERPPALDIRELATSPRALMRAAPYFIVAVAAPFLLLPSIFPPTPPEPATATAPKS
ncbi:hypothetical protein BE221DRAFT_202737 [Ostreococcus tauri]|uniref:2Fe-2S ferredoxin-type domain-containing protein n=1 Tax=Ostreococcus tauri TaxID=70448 RepID=A0A1Y5IIU1_OSTTA|nr:hypothetical protein BE221DRAFT_202737 [Ostreococcus tauri]